MESGATNMPDLQQCRALPQSQQPQDRTETRVPLLNYEFKQGAFWHRIPAWRHITETEFGDHQWQQRNCITSVENIESVLGGELPAGFANDLRAGLQRTPMRIRITPYIFSLIDWSSPQEDPLRRQFLPMGSQFTADHPCCMDDSLNEDGDRSAPFLTHRYPDKVLFLPVSVCPVYCSYCTRSRLVGGSTEAKSKTPYGASKDSWEETFAYIRRNTEIEDVVISGGDAFMLRAEIIEHIGNRLLEIPHVRRFRYATKGLAVLPMKITSDDAWVHALKRISDRGKSMMKEVCIHTHIGSEQEMSEWTFNAMQRLTEMGIKVRNQAVLLRGVNDSFDSMYRTIKKLSYLNIQPYLVFLHDMVPGCEHLRTTLSHAEQLFKQLLGTTAGFNVPRFVCDAPGGGGKRQISSYERYDREIGVSAWVAPRVKPGRIFYYYDPIDQLPESGQAIWANDDERKRRLAAFEHEVQESLALERCGIASSSEIGCGDPHVIR
ncbi:L-lysine 2,3-aminomutase [Novipirellula aureliae]|uniref:L-lysine 2,3-aminomutase n=1 Tax=Novipirellula aureliae TaxID=2527966 RepID=A0A5C6DKE1_9BACT|nr:KamA family radical SAM protein [Novipirellula aureliae]TWU35349.1 L-lysine 2,3-aminomutase [Novipirellula aureliae]